MDNWGRWFRENGDKFILLLVFVFNATLVLHMTHDGRDTDAILWAREMAGTVLGALLGLITGHALASRSAVTVTTTQETK